MTAADARMIAERRILDAKESERVKRDQEREDNDYCRQLFLSLEGPDVASQYYG
jgi:hypothetical protein